MVCQRREGETVVVVNEYEIDLSSDEYEEDIEQAFEDVLFRQTEFFQAIMQNNLEDED